MSAKKSEISVRWGFLTPRKEVASSEHCKEKRTTYICDCDCGSVNCRKTIITTGKRLRDGSVSSCGARDHGHQTIEALREAALMGIYRGYNDGDLKYKECSVLVQQNCFYCNGIPSNTAHPFKRHDKHLFSYKSGEFKYTGLDRLTKETHDLDDVVPACISCNQLKLNGTYEQFILRAQRLNENFRPVFIGELSFVSSKVKEFQDGKPCSSSRAKTILGKLFPNAYVSIKGSFLANKVKIFVHRKENKGRIFLTDIQIADLMLGDCIYCGEKTDLASEKLNTIDRYNNYSEGGNKSAYTADNCVPACSLCNCAKRKLAPDEFRSWIIRLKENLVNLPINQELLLKFVKERNLLLA